MKKSAIFLTMAIPALSIAGEFQGNWTATYKIGPKHDHVISHTPNNVCFDGFICSGKRLHLGGRINGLDLTSSPIDVSTDSTKAEFEQSLIASGLQPVEG